MWHLLFWWMWLHRWGKWSSVSLTWPALLAALSPPGSAAGLYPHIEPRSSAGCCSAHSAFGGHVWAQPPFLTDLCHHWRENDEVSWRYFNTHVKWAATQEVKASVSSHQKHWGLSEGVSWLGPPDKSRPDRQISSLYDILYVKEGSVSLETPPTHLPFTGMFEGLGHVAWLPSTSVLKHKNNFKENAGKW